MDAPTATEKAARINARMGRTASKAVRRQQLIEATIESIAKYGISGTTVTTVTGFAGLSVGIVNFHFENKENLFEETLRFLAAEHRALWLKAIEKGGLSPAEKLQAIVDAEFHPQICNRKKLTVWTAFYGEAGYRKSYRNIMSDIDTERWETSRDLFQGMIETGGLQHLDAEGIADTLEGLFDGFCLNILIYPGEFTREIAKTRVRSYLATTFPGFFEIQKPCGVEAQ
ncbi:MAG: TetR family transcriptional regulator C-terminal domain-containing protein [Roseobacter sp.]